MKVLLDIKDNKADFILELLKNFSFVKVKSISSKKEAFLTELSESIKEVNKANKGDVKLQSLDSFLNEL